LRAAPAARGESNESCAKAGIEAIHDKRDDRSSRIEWPRFARRFTRSPMFMNHG
jgi:hypothetical protein